MNKKISNFKYWAFISYSHKERSCARWLLRRIENFVIPADLRNHVLADGQTLGKYLRPVFRDCDELESVANLSKRIKQALDDSRYLIVICSPNSAKSQWVNQEIEYFLSKGGESRILTLILNGEINSGNPETECFPPVLRNGMEPLAGDLRSGGDGKQRGFLKVFAGIADLKLDQLVRRHERAQRRMRLVLSSVAMMLILTFATLAGIALHQKNIADARTVEAQSRLAESLISSASYELSDEKVRSPANKLEEAREILSSLGKSDLVPAFIQAFVAAYSPKTQTLYESESDPLVMLSASPDGRLLAILAESGEVVIVDRENGSVVNRIKGSKIRSLVFSATNQHLYAMTSQKVVNVYERPRFNRVKQVAWSEETWLESFGIDIELDYVEVNQFGRLLMTQQTLVAHKVKGIEDLVFLSETLFGSVDDMTNKTNEGFAAKLQSASLLGTSNTYAVGLMDGFRIFSPNKEEAGGEGEEEPFRDFTSAPGKYNRPLVGTYSIDLLESDDSGRFVFATGAGVNEIWNVEKDCLVAIFNAFDAIPSSACFLSGGNDSSGSIAIGTYSGWINLFEFEEVNYSKEKGHRVGYKRRIDKFEGTDAEPVHSLCEMDADSDSKRTLAYIQGNAKVQEVLFDIGEDEQRPPWRSMLLGKQDYTESIWSIEDLLFPRCTIQASSGSKVLLCDILNMGVVKSYDLRTKMETTLSLGSTDTEIVGLAHGDDDNRIWAVDEKANTYLLNVNSNEFKTFGKLGNSIGIEGNLVSDASSVIVGDYWSIATDNGLWMVSGILEESPTAVRLMDHSFVQSGARFHYNEIKKMVYCTNGDTLFAIDMKAPGNAPEVLLQNLGARSPDYIAISDQEGEPVVAVADDILESVTLQSSASIDRTIDVSKGITTLAFSPDGAALIVGTRLGNITIYSVRTGQELFSWEGFAPIFGISILSPNVVVLTVMGDHDIYGADLGAIVIQDPKWCN